MPNITSPTASEATGAIQRGAAPTLVGTFIGLMYVPVLLDMDVPMRKLTTTNSLYGVAINQVLYYCRIHAGDARPMRCYVSVAPYYANQRVVLKFLDFRHHASHRTI